MCVKLEKNVLLFGAEILTALLEPFESACIGVFLCVFLGETKFEMA